MNLHRLANVHALLLLAAICLCVNAPARADTEHSLTACEPSLAQAGEILLLSLSGDLPPGELTVEFFPQRISVLSAYAIDRRTLAVQISVPLDAPAGRYNILVYNDQGDEALGSELLEVQRRVRVPKISTSSPEEVDAKLSEVKLSLRCDILDAEALQHLSVEWTVDGKPQEGISTAIARGGVNSISLTVTGEAEPGVALGRVFFDSTPIYLIRLARVSSEWLLFGHRPARATADGPGLEITLLGEGLNSDLLDGATAYLLTDGARRVSAQLTCVDGSRAAASFSPIPTPGEYSLEVEQGGVVVYQGPLLLLAGRNAQEPASASSRSRVLGEPVPEQNVAKEQTSTSVERPRSRNVPQWEEAAPSIEDDTRPTQSVAAPGVGQSEEQTADEATGPAQLAPPPVEPGAGTASAMAYELSPAQIDSNKPVLRLEISGFVPEHPDLDRYSASLSFEQDVAQLMFMGLGEQRLILLFSAPESGWLAGETYRLILTRKDDGADVFNLLIPAA